MCNLYTMTATVDEIRRVFGPFAGDRANICLPMTRSIPGRPAPVLRRGGEGLVMETMTWGFPGPAAAKGRPVTNIRNLESPFWRSALNSVERRCIVPVTRFCEWTAEPDAVTKRKAKVWFGLHPCRAGGAIVRFAGLWRPGEGGPFMAFLTVRCECIGWRGASKAMPVMLRPEDARAWLEHPRESACALAQPFADADMRIINCA
jgi:putative SOS response-associated peptidase YedK